jgi:hypothetical protein
MSQPRFYVRQESTSTPYWAIIDRTTDQVATIGTSPDLDWRSASHVGFSKALLEERALELNCRFDGWKGLEP